MTNKETLKLLSKFLDKHNITFETTEEEEPIANLRASNEKDKLLELGFKDMIFVDLTNLNTFLVILGGGQIASGSNCMVNNGLYEICETLGLDCDCQSIIAEDCQEFFFNEDNQLTIAEPSVLKTIEDAVEFLKGFNK